MTTQMGTSRGKNKVIALNLPSKLSCVICGAIATFPSLKYLHLSAPILLIPFHQPKLAKLQEINQQLSLISFP